MPEKEATARIKINRLLEAAGWRFFPQGSAPANICLEPSVKIKSTDLDALGDNFEKTTNGFVDFLLLDARGFPFIVPEAEAEDKNPLLAKEQARKYARSQNCRFVMLSNGNLHYFFGSHWRGTKDSIADFSLRSFTIPLPPLATQQAIVAEIEAEQALVAANRELVTRCETLASAPPV
jgi:type I restriction enzyme R subunit